MTLAKKLFYSLLTIGFTVSCSTVELTKKEKIQALARYDNLTDRIAKNKKLCVQETKKINPLKLAKDNPEFFGGIKPGSKYWPEVEIIYSEYMNTACNYLNEEKVLEKYVEIYSEEISDRALDEILNFYQTKTGKEYLKATESGNDRMQKYYAESATPAYEKAMKKYTEEVGALIRKCRCENKLLRTR